MDETNPAKQELYRRRQAAKAKRPQAPGPRWLVPEPVGARQPLDPVGRGHEGGVIAGGDVASAVVPGPVGASWASTAWAANVWAANAWA